MSRRRPAPGRKSNHPAQESVGRLKHIQQGRFVWWLLGGVLVAAVVFAYQPAWNAGYIWDDDMYVTKNPLLTAADGLRRIWFSFDAPSQYFPLTYTTFRLEHALWGFNPAGYHWVNILLHATNALLLWRLLHLLGIRGAWFAAGLFALHPVQVESVAWITELKNVLMGFFFLLTLLYWAHFIEAQGRPRRNTYYALALLCFALALFSKSTAVTLPVALLLTLWLKRETISLARCAQIAPFVLMAAGMGVITIWWERYHQGTHGPAFSIGFGERLLVANHAIWFYLSKLIWPAELSFSYERWPVSLREPLNYVWVGLTVIAGFFLWWLRVYARRGWYVAIFFFVATLAPVLGFVMLWTFRYSWVADHYQYLACVGPLALASSMITREGSEFGPVGRAILVIAAVGVLALLSVQTWEQCRIYQDAETLWRATIQTNPKSALAYNSLGVILGEKNAPIEDEMTAYRKALEADPNDPQAHNNLGYALQRLGRFPESLEEYEKSIAADPRYAIAHGNLAMVLLRLGRKSEAVQHLQKVREIEPKNALLEHSLGDILASEGRADEAIQHWKRSIDLGTRDATLSAQVGNLLASRGKLKEALPYLREASELNPADAQMRSNYAAALLLLDRFADAVPYYQEAIRLRPDLEEAHSNLAICFVKMGRFDEAVEEYKRAVELKPNNRDALNQLSLILRHLGRAEEADVYALRAANGH